MKLYWTTKKFKQLEKKWEERLKKSGFKDIEKMVGEKRVLLNKTQLQVDPANREEYYRQVRNHMWLSQYDSFEERRIIFKVGMGWTIKDICKELPYSYERGRQIVRHITHKYETRWGIRKWKINSKL